MILFPIANAPPLIYIFYEFLANVHDSGKLFKVSKEESSMTYNGFWLRGCAVIFPHCRVGIKPGFYFTKEGH